MDGVLKGLSMAGVLGVILFASAIPVNAFSQPAIKASGTFPPTTTLSVKLSGLTIYVVSTGPITGTFSGQYISIGNITTAANGLSATFVAMDYCYCNFTDTHGTQPGLITFYEQGTVVVTDPLHGTGNLLSVATIIPSQTTIQGLTGSLVFTGVTNSFTLVNSGTYAGLVSNP